MCKSLALIIKVKWSIPLKKRGILIVFKKKITNDLILYALAIGMLKIIKFEIKRIDKTSFICKIVSVYLRVHDILFTCNFHV